MLSAIFAIVFLLNLFLIVAGSSRAVPFETLLLIVFLWFGIPVPLSAVGSFYGAKNGIRIDQVFSQSNLFTGTQAYPWVDRRH